MGSNRWLDALKAIRLLQIQLYYSIAGSKTGELFVVGHFAVILSWGFPSGDSEGSAFEKVQILRRGVYPERRRRAPQNDRGCVAAQAK